MSWPRRCLRPLACKADSRLLQWKMSVHGFNHLRTHPSVAAGLAVGSLTLHGWLFELEHGQVLTLDGETGCFVAMDSDAPPVAVPPRSGQNKRSLPIWAPSAQTAE